MILMTILSTRTGDGTPDSPYRPQFAEDYPALDYNDTGAETSTHFVLETRVDEAQAEAIRVDARYVILSEEPIENDELPGE